ncbi:MAG: hypothetical protein C0608_00955 [Deltaproteobacteria bacterium]|nr:MAG: hypothetical protein C0608_00955 [Deltaproteobacteria bacterium]
MKQLKNLLLIVTALSLVSCGPIMGNLMTMGGGVKDIEVTKGDTATFKAGKKLLVLAPFLKGEDGYYVSRGDDAANLLDAINGISLFEGQFLFEPDYYSLEKKAAEYKSMSPKELKALSELDFTPEYLLVGTILSRDTVVAPTRGVMMDVTYSLEFVDLSSGENLIIKVRAKDLFPEVAPDIAGALAELLSKG